MIEVGTTTTVRLVSGQLDLAGESVPAKVFGELVKLATPHIERYHSDLYHDAKWLQHYVVPALQEHASFTFYYAARESGTAIGTDVGLVTQLDYVDVWRIVVKREGSWWVAEIGG